VGFVVGPFLLVRKVKSRAFILVYGRITVGTKLYCGNLGYNVSTSDLEQLFLEFGSVKRAEVISDRDTSRSKGFGFVEMASPAEALAAIKGLDGREVDGRPLKVNEAKPRENRSGGSQGGYGGGRGRRN
jgi:RNA recognition motif-containing protein